MAFKIPIKNKYLSFFVNEVLMTVLVVILLILLYKWWVLHGTVEVVKTGNVTVLADKDLEGYDSFVLGKAVEQADSLLLSKGFDLTDDVTILIVKDRDSYRKRTLHFRSQALGVYLQLLSVVVVMPPDFKTMMQPANEPGLMPRPVASVLAHEMCHCYQFEYRGWLSAMYDMLFEKWKVEGLADYVAGSSSLNIEQGEKIFVENGEEHAKLTADKGIWGYSYFYFVSRLRTEYLISHKGVSPDEFWNTDYGETDLEQLDNEIRQAIENGSFDMAHGEL